MAAGPYHDEPDSASFSDEPSPRRILLHHEHPQDKYMSSSNASASKARETEAENKIGLQGRRTRRTPPSSVDPDETTLLIDASQPPTYFNATANPYQGYTVEQNEGQGVEW
jgi:hypothetical protein